MVCGGRSKKDNLICDLCVLTPEQIKAIEDNDLRAFIKASEKPDIKEGGDPNA
jgi:hypothetical protein